MRLIETLSKKWSNINVPFLIHSNAQLKFSDITSQKLIDLKEIKEGNVVALIGDLNLHQF